MVMLEDIQRIVLGIIVLIIIVVTFNQMFASPECNNMAEITAQELRDAIHVVASEDGVKVWDKEGPPPSENIDYYRSVPVRLCEEDISFIDKLGVNTPFGEISTPNEFKFTGGAWAAHLPTYLIVYEQFPSTRWYHVWDEGYPWSGGAVNALFAYAAL